jgi:hypothetical protein
VPPGGGQLRSAGRLDVVSHKYSNKNTFEGPASLTLVCLATDFIDALVVAVMVLEVLVWVIDHAELASFIDEESESISTYQHTLK